MPARRGAKTAKSAIISGRARRMKILEMLIENNLRLVDSNVSTQIGLRMDIVKSHFDYLAAKFGALWIERGVHTLEVNPIIRNLYSHRFFEKFLEEKTAKNTIARYVVDKFITTDDCIAIDSGSTTAYIASQLVALNKFPSAIVTTNIAVYFALQMCGYTAIQKSPGNYDLQYQEARGDEAANFIKEQSPNKSFVSFACITKAGELKVFENDQKPVKLIMLSPGNKEKIIIVLDHTKIGHTTGGPTVVRIQDLQPRNHFVLVTDNGISKEKQRVLNDFAQWIDVQIAN